MWFSDYHHSNVIIQVFPLFPLYNNWLLKFWHKKIYSYGNWHSNYNQIFGSAPTITATIARAGSFWSSKIPSAIQRAPYRFTCCGSFRYDRMRKKKVEPILTSLNLLQKQTEKMMSLFSLPSASQRTWNKVYMNQDSLII